MQSIIRVVTLSIGCALLGACATITRGSTMAWDVRTTPPGASVRTSNGLSCNSTPCSMEVSRRAHFTATVSKPGYKNVDVAVSHTVSTAGGVALAGNVIVGGLIGVGVDVATGAYNDLTPNNIDLKLESNEVPTLALFGSYSSPVDRLGLQYTASASPRNSFPVVVDQPQNPYEGRVIEVKVLSDGSTRELRERP